MMKRKIAERVVATPAHLDELIEEVTVDCHDDYEQASGFFNMTSCASPKKAPEQHATKRALA